MKKELTKEQSARLIELGVPKEKASTTMYEGSIRNAFPIYNLTDILEILPKEIERDFCVDFCIKYSNGRYYAGYGFNEPYEGFGFEKFYTAEELIDAVYELLRWVLENKYLKF